jgi:FtsH-binding integral membrane protein
MGTKTPPFMRERTAEQETHMVKVHAVVGVGLAVAAYGAKIHMQGGLDIGLPFRIEGSDFMTLVQIICIVILGLGEANARLSENNTDGIWGGISFWRGSVYLMCAFAAGLNVGTWVLYAAQENGLCDGTGWSFLPDTDWLQKLQGRQCELFEELVFSSFLLTAGTYICCFVAALVAPSGQAKFFAPIIACSLFIMSLTYWASRIFGWMGTDGFDIIYVQFGLIVYCIKVFVDTQIIYERVANGERDVISHAIVIFFNILHMFIRIVQVVARVIKDRETNKLKCAFNELQNEFWKKTE